jgi:uncharacterized protein (TIGR03435 family)
MSGFDVGSRGRAVCGGLAFLLGLLLTTSGTLRAQGVIGTWQGTLPIAQNPRLVLKIAKNDDGSLRGVFYRIDQYEESLPLSSVSFQASDLSIASAIQEISYRGKLSTDGQSITGTWIQNKQSYPLIFAAATADKLWTYGGSKAVPAMSPTADPAFEVATIKPSAPGAGGRSGSGHTHLFSSKNATLHDLIKMAYLARDRQIEGEPVWVSEEKFDLQAEPDTPGLPSDEQVRTMLKKLLADRFQLKFHTAQKPLPVYALMVEKNPPKLVKSDPTVNRFAHIMPKQQPDGQLLVAFVYDRMPEFADILMNFIPDRQIVDETGLVGPYDFTITVPAIVLQNGPTTDEGERANVFTGAVQSLGLKLVPKKEPVDVMVIERVEKPTGN